MKILNSKLLIVISLTLGNFSAHDIFAQSVALKGSVKGAAGYTVVLLNKDGSSKTKLLTSNGSFNFSGTKLKNLKNASLQLIGTDGRFYGPVVLGKKR